MDNSAIGYMRLSVRDQSKYSLEYQEKSIRDYAERNNLNLTAIFKDNGQSSYTFDRPDYQTLEKFIRKHKGQNQFLIIMDHDRFSRNLPEALMKIKELEDKYQLKVLATNESIDLDTKDPDVFLQRAFKYLMANQELLRIRKRTRDGIRQAHSSGRYVNGAPFGYLKGRDANNKTLLQIDEAKAPIVRMIFDEYLNGTSFPEIRKKIRDMGFKHTGHSAVQRILSTGLYAGLIKLPAEKNLPERTIKGLHQPIISEAQYWTTQERLGHKRGAKVRPKEDFPLRGTIKCWCGKYMTAGYSKGKSKYYAYYRCNEHNSINIPAAMLHNKFEEVLDQLSFTEEQLKKIGESAKAYFSNEVSHLKKISVERKKQLLDINGKIDKLEAKLMNDDIDSETYKKWRESFSRERAILQSDIETSANGTDKLSEKWSKLNTYLQSFKSVKELYKIATFELKRTLIQRVFNQFLTFSEGVFRTLSLNISLSHNLLKIKEKGLLFVEQPNQIWEDFPSSSEIGN